MQLVVVFLIAVTQVQAGPLSIQRRKALDVWSPTIIVPTPSTVWQNGSSEFVKWDMSNAPKSISNRGYVTLKYTPPNGGTSQVRRLAGPFNLRDGNVTFIMPNDVVTGQFSIILFGDSGNESKQFHINGIAAPADGKTMVGGTSSSDPFGP
ncbi:hypothetical protein Agabi119p4_3341 [Agaricus bisporus var. burnettii]|uniref:Uncharacterized protein n=1 Tax=Agaricus bisporus var. burnettii TaxID=192524 RepID=A0A8H7F711_AGABI|nr:hypothetical protein Agabi119p4_3341 [Agaricus bisporus var. burnettii]